MWPANDDVMKLLASRGLADPTTGKLLAGSLISAVETASGAVQNTEYTVGTATLPADFLNRANKGLLIAAFGTTAANANAKTLKVKVGSVVVATVAGATDNAKDFLFLVWILRTGVDTQVAYSLLIMDGALVAASCGIAAEAIDDGVANAITLTAANTAAAAASATGKGLVVHLLG
jgi:hypothetical protein